MSSYYDPSAKPQFDITIYLAPPSWVYQGYQGLPNTFVAQPSLGRGNTPETPMQVPRDYRINGVSVDISIPPGIFYDYHEGNCRYYTDLFDVWITSKSILDEYGNDCGFCVAADRSEPPYGHVEIDSQPLAEGGAYMRSLYLDGNPIYLDLLVRYWQVWDPDPRYWDDPPWSYEYRRYRSDPIYLEDATFIYCTSEPTGAEVRIKNADHPYGLFESTGHTPAFYFAPRGFSGHHSFDVKTETAGYKPHVGLHNLCFAAECWTTGTPGWAHHHAVLEPLGCSSPSGMVEHGTTDCDGYDQYQCTRGTWKLIERDAPACGYPKPVADFTARWNEESPPCEVSFTDLSYDNPTAWVWDFGDGTGSVEQNPTHTYTAAGAFTVRLEASNKSGSDITTGTVYVMHPCVGPTGPHGDLNCIGWAWSKCDDGTWVAIDERAGECGYPAPTASFAVWAIDSKTREIQFEDTSVPAPTSWLWDFGDDTTSIEQHPLHTYTMDGTYTVTLHASNHIGESVADTILDVEAHPEPGQVDGYGIGAGIGLAAVAAVCICAATRRREN